MSARFLEGEIAAELRVARVSTQRHTVTVGSVFVDPGPTPPSSTRS
jgi:hypothetical protein